MIPQRVLKGTKIIETIENYSFVGNNHQLIREDEAENLVYRFSNNNEFWRTIIEEPDHYWHKRLSFNHFIICDWVPRVPGLYWADYSSSLRYHTEKEIAVRSKESLEFYPNVKSRKVLGGLGTILLPPNDEGKRIFSISSNGNASLGIPLLVFPEVWDSLLLKQGDEVNILSARWQPLDVSWASRFATTKDLPRGYLVVDHKNMIKITKRNTPVIYHPFSIMEYQNRDALLYDFVYLTIDNTTRSWRKNASHFFNKYAKKENRNGHYLLNPNLLEPLFDAQYMTPQDMQGPIQRAQLELIYQRIYKINFNKTSLERLIQLLPKYYDSSIEIKRLARSIGINLSVLKDDTAASLSIQIINHCMKTSKIEELIDRMIVEYPHILN